MKTSSIRLQDSGLTLRHLVPGDHAAWAQLYRQYAEFYHVPMTDAVLARTWSWLMSAEHAEEGVVAELADSRLAGLAHFRSYPKPLLGQDAGFLDDLFVSPAHRGQGIGRSLIQAVAAIASERGWPQLRWITAKNNQQARQLYDTVSQATSWVTYELKPGAHQDLPGKPLA
ncbi:GNAT family N-acetyltransferase [Kerstersia sp.]|uniref:GNAT family N-acetyltransferase n=1 Tax=Kerstersia sp. TaxID=1930783 RepID=UPI003F928B45